MTKKLTAYMIEKVTALMEAPTCCAEAKAVCAEWLEAAGTDKEAESLLPKLKQTLCLLTV